MSIVWALAGVRLPLPGALCDQAELWMLAGEGGHRALRNVLAFEGRLWLTHGIPSACCLAESPCSSQLDWLSCPHAAAHQVETLTAGHCHPAAFASNFASSVSPPLVLASAMCAEVPG